MQVAAVEWGPVATWAGAVATLLVVGVTALVALGWFDTLRGPRLVLVFEPIEPWVRERETDGRAAVWMRVGVQNDGIHPARGCVGRLTCVETDGVRRPDVDPVQLRWAGVPRSLAFDPIDIRRGQREYLNVVCLVDRAHWQIVTFDEADFDLGFITQLASAEPHDLHVSVACDNADTATYRLHLDARSRDWP